MRDEFAAIAASKCASCFNTDKCVLWKCVLAEHRREELLRRGEIEMVRKIFGEAGSVFAGEYREPWDVPLEPSGKK